MTAILVLFFTSLIGIIIMIGRKLATTQNGQIIEKEYVHSFVPDFQKIKRLAFENVKKYEHASLVIMLRFYIRFSNFLKNKYQEVKTKIKKVTKSNLDDNLPEKVEVNKFLKMISDYKHKIREIKHKIHEEEKNS